MNLLKHKYTKRVTAMIDINKNKLSCNTLNAGPLPVWGDIVGDITKQEDLKALLDSYVDEPELLQALLNSNIELKRWVDEQGYLKEHQHIKTVNGESLIGEGDITIQGGSLTPEQEELINQIPNKADRSDIPDVSNLATKAEVDAVEAKIPDVSNFATKDEIPSLDGYATESWVEGKGYLTEHQDLSDYAKKTDIPDVSGYATKEDLNSKADKTDLEGYATKEYVDGLIGELNTITEDILS